MVRTGSFLARGWSLRAASSTALRPSVVPTTRELCSRTFLLLHSFGTGLDGATPVGGLTFDSNGNLYGTTESGGKSGEGTLFKIDINGNESVLHDFDFSTGAIPVGALNYVPKCKCIFGTTSQSSPGLGTVWQFIL